MKREELSPERTAEICVWIIQVIYQFPANISTVPGGTSTLWWFSSEPRDTSLGYFHWTIAQEFIPGLEENTYMRRVLKGR